MNKDKLRTAFTEADKQLEKALQDVEFVKECLSRFAEINHNMGMLNDFYHSPMWIEGHEGSSDLFPDEHFRSASEDGIWDTTQELYFLKIRLMKLLADDLEKTVPEYYR